MIAPLTKSEFPSSKTVYFSIQSVRESILCGYLLRHFLSFYWMFCQILYALKVIWHEQSDPHNFSVEFHSTAHCYG